jgi:hypothetical protein
LCLAQRLVDPGEQGELGERFLEDVHFRAVGAMAGKDRLSVARHVQHGQAGPVLKDALGDIGAEHLRHDHVGQQQVHAMGRVGRVLDRGRAGTGLVDVVAVAGQDPVPELAEALLVLDQQDDLALPALVLGRGGRPAARERGGLVAGGDQHGKRGPKPWLGVDLRGPAGLGDDAVDRGQPEAGAMALGLGGEEGLEGAVDGGLVHARAGVGDTQPDVAARPQAGPGLGVGGVGFQVVGLDAELPAARHGVAGVDGEVHQHLLELAPVGLDEPQLGVAADLEVDVLTEGAVQ